VPHGIQPPLQTAICIFQYFSQGPDRLHLEWSSHACPNFLAAATTASTIGLPWMLCSLICPQSWGHQQIRLKCVLSEGEGCRGANGLASWTRLLAHFLFPRRVSSQQYLYQNPTKSTSVKTRLQYRSLFIFSSSPAAIVLGYCSFVDKHCFHVCHRGTCSIWEHAMDCFRVSHTLTYGGALADSTRM
jgi:hypothetical protein